MFLHNLDSSDPRFHTLTFHDGMNILLADRTSKSTMGDSRNGAGKTSFVKIIRYLLGGSLDKSLNKAELRSHSFKALITIGESLTAVERPISPTTKVTIDGVSKRVEEWRTHLGAEAFSLPPGTIQPTAGQLSGQLVRTYFEEASKTFPQESRINSGIRIGYFLGFAPEILNKAADVAALKKHHKELQSVIKSGALPYLSIKGPELRAQLAQAKSQRQQLKEDLASFKVDRQYAEHQREADRLSAQLRILNESALALRRRQSEIEQVTKIEQPNLFMAPETASPDRKSVV